MIVSNLHFQHQKHGPYFFKGLSLNLEEGCIHALHGKNGVGKSVLLHILSKETSAVLMSQQFDQSLVGQFNFLENFQMGSFQRFPSPLSRLRHAPIPLNYLLLLERFQIDVRIPVHKLSGGQRQILALIMKLQRNPKVLLLDEPTAALDGHNATMVFEFLKALKDITILIVCHDQDLMQQYTTGQHLYMDIDQDGIRNIKGVCRESTAAWGR